MSYERDPDFAPTAEQRANLTKLADYLAALPEGYQHFDMGTFMGARSDDGRYLGDIGITEAKPLTRCGSCACAIGHGPSAGLAIAPNDADWSGYAQRVFGAGSDSDGPGEYMFGLDKPNDPHAAAARIREVLAAHSEPAS